MTGKNQNEFQQLVQKYLDGTATPEELDVLDRYYLLFRDEPASTALLSEQELLQLEHRIENGLFKRIQQPAKLTRLWPRIAIAAAVATIIFGAGLFYFNSDTENKTDQVAYKNDVAPGKMGATLTLANGRKIFINSALTGNIANQSGVKISRSKDGQIIYEVTDQNSGDAEFNTLSTSRGEQTQVRLPDGSVVFLNAESSLKYPANFAKLGKRHVSLTGEGYFEVAKDKSHPFVVTTYNQEVNVLGTHFNINAYADDPEAKTTLLEGSIHITASGVSKTLKPGQQAVHAGNDMQIFSADTELAVAWKNNEFMFEEQSIKSVMKMVERWYTVEVIYQGDIPLDKFSGVVSRFDNVSKVLSVLESTGRIKFKIEGRRIYVLR
ncbi:FecR family protein [Pedobacter hartonius]|uniref:FecR family protein n=1 Tax=Pedobacter hartonius TaxID=425514 RepID=A0A1H4CU48_9SPHI|nr:FecR family protein [Pedobacter hartonius]SEA63895.1 FecR family protein [Pedobacter hartonius]